jgi:hypothetical protein
MVEWWYGCSGGNRCACSFSFHEPYGRLSYDQRFLAQRVEQGAHPVRLEPQRELELVRRHGLEVVRPVEPCRAVHRPAGRLDQGDVLGLGDVARALEHHVLEQVGEPRLARLLVLGADVVPEVDRGDRSDAVGSDDDPEPVVEGALTEADARGVDRRAGHRARS